MGVFLFRHDFQRWIAITFCVLLTACGGGSGSETVPDTPVGQQPPVSSPPVGGTPVEMALMVAFGYNPLAAGSPLRRDQVQQLAVGNGSATYRFPRSGERISGNLTIAVNVADPDGIARVLVGFNGSEQALVLCQTNCGSAFSQTLTGVNPRNFGLTPGSLRLELWLEDQLGNRILFDARDIEWQPEPVVGVNTNRSAGALQVNWTANSNARRYNLYIAEQPGITPENILSKSGGRQFLALTQSSFSVPDLQDNRRYFMLITGVDSSGESLYSEQHVIQPVGAPEFSAPVASPDQFSVNEDTEFRGSLLGNDSHPDARRFSLDPQAVRSPENGVVVLNTDGSFSYTPAANFSGSDSFIYQITDTQGLTAQALVSLTVLATNDRPTALDDSYSLNRNTSLTIAAPGVLANDFDLDGDTLTLERIALTAPSHGSLQLSPDGAFIYTPIANFSGEDFFVYQISDPQGGVAQAKVSLRIEMTNAAPVAQTDSYQLGEDEQLTVTASAGILANDTDPDGDSVSLVTELLSTVQNGQLILASDGSFQYIPNQDFFGTDSFSYQIKDPAGLVGAATVVLTVLAQNDPPVVQAATYSVNSNATLSVAAPGLLAYAFDVEAQSLTLDPQLVVAPTKGSVSLSIDGGFVYTPDPGIAGTDSFIFAVQDDAGASGAGSVVINIVTQGTAPVFNDSALQVLSTASSGELVAQLFAIDTDFNDVLTFSIVSGNESGVFSLTTAGMLSIANPASLITLAGSSLTLAVQAQDQYGLIDLANVQINIVAGGLAANSDSYTILQNTSITVAAPGVLGNDADSSGLTLTATLISAPSHGQLALSADGSFVYAPASSFYGQDSFVYQASNGIATAQATVGLMVTPMSYSLQANFDSYTLTENTILTVQSSNSLLQNDLVNPNTAVTVSLVQAPASGTLNLNTDGTFVYQPAPDSFGAYYFTYRLTQGGVTSDAMVELNIVATDPAPVLPDAAVTISDDYVNLQQVFTFSPIDTNAGHYSYQILSGNSDGVFSITAGGVVQIANPSLLNASITPSYNLVVKVIENGDISRTDTATLVVTVLAAQTDETSVIADNSFASGANLSLEMMLSGENNEPVQIIPLSTGGSLVIGTVSSASVSPRIFVAKLTSNGDIDTSYAEKGLFKNKIIFSSLSERAVAAVVTGTNELVILVNYTDNPGSGFFLVKLTAQGVLDSSFGSGVGYVICAVNECGGDAEATDLLLNEIGHYVVAGAREDTDAFLLEYADSGYQDGWIGNISTIEQFDLVRQDSDGNYYAVGTSTTGFILVARFNSSFDLDSGTFGCVPSCVGYQEYSFSQLSTAAFDAVLHNDELYIVGSATSVAAPSSPDGIFFKVASDGSLDSGFGASSGFTLVNGYLGSPLYYQSIALDTTGFYILTTTEQSGENSASLSHYDLTGQFIVDQPLAVSGELKAVDLQSDSAGLWLLNHFSHPDYGPAASISFNWVAKYNLTPLSADPVFSADGHRWFSAGFSNDTLVGSQRLLLGAQVNKTLFYGYSESIWNDGYKQAFVGRLTSSGALDHTFGNHGLVLVADHRLTKLDIKALSEASLNQFYLAGRGLDLNSSPTGFVMRFNQDGSVDSNFSAGLFDLIPSAIGNYVSSNAVQLQLRADGHLLVGAEYSQAAGNVDVALLQLNTDGTLDTGSFGHSASGFTVFSEIDHTSATEERLSVMKLDPVDGSLVIAGQYKWLTDPKLYVARFSASGLLMNTTHSLSNAFGPSGLGYSLINLVANSTGPIAYTESLNALEFDAGRNLLVALSVNSESGDSHYLYRLLGNGLTDLSFNSGNPRLYSSFSDQVPLNLKIKAIHTDTAGRLLMAGTYGVDAWVGRVLLDGSGSQVGRWDPSFEANSATPGAYLFTGFSFSSDLFIQLNSSKVTLGWSNYDSGGYRATLRQYQLYYYD